ncbi:hypothetical protein BSA145_09090 [Bacillus safensis]|uniref:Uncharacterized protein n=1 Tax=Bacillus safensis TaxID=561879 RepID=A0A1L6ZHP0_BACIA|nr:hypothetical protein BSA145_09090 [Bacillus safensis]
MKLKKIVEKHEFLYNLTKERHLFCLFFKQTGVLYAMLTYQKRNTNIIVMLINIIYRLTYKRGV